MNDKVFGTVNDHPLWAVYDCGTEIRGEIDIQGNCHRFHFTYLGEEDSLITGNFGALKISLGKLRKEAGRIIYPIKAGEKTYFFPYGIKKFKKAHD